MKYELTLKTILKILMENIKSVSKSGTKVIIHCINGDFLMNVFKEKDKYEVIKDNEVVFYKNLDDLCDLIIEIKNNDIKF